MLWEHALKLVIASLVGLIVGTERALQNKNVGVGTCSSITMASTLLTILAYEMTSGDPSRLVANIITSVGFLCGGVIFVRGTDSSNEVVGLTTGAILFCLSSVGIAVGLGYYPLVVVSTLLILVNVSIARLFKNTFIIMNQRVVSRYVFKNTYLFLFYKIYIYIYIVY